MSILVDIDLDGEVISFVNAYDFRALQICLAVGFVYDCHINFQYVFDSHWGSLVVDVRFLILVRESDD